MNKVGKMKRGKRDKEEQEYVLIAGTHRDGSGGDRLEYEAGDTITTDKPMDKLFPNKWKPVNAKVRRPLDRSEALDQGGPSRVMDRPKGTFEPEEGDEDGINVTSKKKKHPRPEKKQTTPSDRDFEPDEDEEEEETTEAEDTEENEEQDTEEDTEEAEEETPKRKKKSKKKSKKAK